MKETERKLKRFRKKKKRTQSRSNKIFPHQETNNNKFSFFFFLWMTQTSSCCVDKRQKKTSAYRLFCMGSAAVAFCVRAFCTESGRVSLMNLEILPWLRPNILLIPILKACTHTLQRLWTNWWWGDYRWRSWGELLSTMDKVGCERLVTSVLLGNP